MKNYDPISYRERMTNENLRFTIYGLRMKNEEWRLFANCSLPIANWSRNYEWRM